MSTNLTGAEGSEGERRGGWWRNGGVGEAGDDDVHVTRSQYHQKYIAGRDFYLS